MKKQETANTFSDGLIMDLNPLSMSNTALTNCLNGTYLTYNGNENMLQNDMGNCRVETAMLPAGYIPLGSTSFGGIIYIVSYNPIDGKYQIGSFPSPERNLSKDELGDEGTTEISLNGFCDSKGWQTNTKTNNGDEAFWSTETIITNYKQKINLSKSKIYPGDKYKIFSDNIYDIKSIISAYNNSKKLHYLDPRYLKFEIVSTSDDGTITELTKNSNWNTVENESENESDSFYIYRGEVSKNDNNLSLSEYRTLVGSNYDVYVNNESGLLGIVAKLEVPTTFLVSYQSIVQNIDENTNSETYNMYFLFNWANELEGDHKNRVNPQYIKLDIYSNSNEEPILTTTYPINLLYRKDSETNLSLPTFNSANPDSIKEIDYQAIISPSDFDYSEEKLRAYFDGNVNYVSKEKYRANDGTDFQYLQKGFTLTNDDSGYWITGCDNSTNSKFSDDIETEYNLQISGSLECIPVNINNNKIATYSDNNGENNEKTSVSNIFRLVFTPVMPFGQLDFLKKEITIDADKLNKNILTFNNYQYYVTTNEITFSFYAEAYLDLGESVTEITLDLFDDSFITADYSKGKIFLNQDIYSNESSDDYIKDNPIQTFTINTSPLTGQITYTINQDDTNLTFNNIYLVRFTFNLASGNKKYFYRLFFNTNIFNAEFGGTKDFKDLYLHSSSQKGGINPIVTLSNSAYLNIEDSPNISIPLYSEERKSVTQPLGYDLNLSISDSEVKITSGLNNIAILIEKEDMEISKSHEFSYDDGILITNDTFSEIKYTKEGKLSFEHSFTVIVDEIINYTKLGNLVNYGLNRLIDGTTNHKILLQHASREERDGLFTIFDTESDGTSEYDSDNILYQYKCSNEITDITYTSEEIEAYLTKIMNSNGYDYMTIIFGIAGMGDKDCGYGYKKITNSSGTFYKAYRCHSNYVNTNTRNCFIAINCIRNYEGNVILIYQYPAKLISLPDTDLNFKEVDDEVEAYVKFIDILDAIDDNNQDFRIVKSDYNSSVLSDGVFSSSLYRYKTSSGTKSLYYINSINGLEDPKITVTYNFELKPNSISVTLNDTNCNNVKNLIIDDLGNINLSLTVSKTLPTSEIINPLYNLPQYEGWDSENEQPLLSDDFSKIYKYDLSVINELIYDGEYVKLSQEYAKNSEKVQWYFGWENTNGLDTDSCDKGYKAITVDDFKNSSQWYKFNYLWANNELTSVSNNDRLPKYTIYRGIDKPIIGQTYYLTISRTSRGDVVKNKNITITSKNIKNLSSSFVDNGNSSFSISLQYIPDSYYCEIILTYNDIIVGSTSFSAYDLDLIQLPTLN